MTPATIEVEKPKGSQQECSLCDSPAVIAVDLTEKHPPYTFFYLCKVDLAEMIEKLAVFGDFKVFKTDMGMEFTGPRAVWAGSWCYDQPYLEGDWVVHAGEMFRCNLDHPATDRMPPKDKRVWDRKTIMSRPAI